MIQRNFNLTNEQVLALYLYSKEKDKEWPVNISGISLIINTAHPVAARLHDIASDFTRYVNKDPVLGECFDVARTIVLGDVNER